MPNLTSSLLKKNQLLELDIDTLSSDGSGVGRWQGMAIFVPGTAPGDHIQARVTKALKSYAFARVEQLLTPGPGRCEPDCPVCAPCGGCSLRRGGSRIRSRFLNSQQVRLLQHCCLLPAA